MLYPNKTEEFEIRWKNHLKSSIILSITEKRTIFKAGDDENCASFMTIQSKESGIYLQKLFKKKLFLFSMMTIINDEFFLFVDLQDGIILYFIPYLLKPVPVKRKVNGTFRPSATEIRQSFLLLVEVCILLCTKLFSSLEVQLLFTCVFQNENDVRSSLTSLLSQPTLIFVGNLEQLRSFYVAFYDTLYEVDTPLEALKFAFHLIFALDLEYSPIAENIWRLLQIAAFNITIPGEKIATQVTTLIGKLALPKSC